MTGNIVLEIVKWFRTDMVKDGSVLMVKNIKVTKRRIMWTLFAAIILTTMVYLYLIFNTVSLTYEYSDNAKVKSQLVSNNYIAESEYYVEKLKEIPQDFSKDFVKPASVVYYQVPKSIFALK